MLLEARKILFNELKKMEFQKVFVKKNTVLLNQDEIMKNIYILLYGNFKLTHTSEDAKSFTLGYYSNYGILIPDLLNGESSLISLFKVETIENSMFGVIPVSKLDLNDKLKLELMEYYHIVSQKIYLQMRDLLFNNKLNALISILIRLSNSYGLKVNNEIKIDIKLSNKDLAEYIGSSTETVSRIMSKLKKENILYCKEKYIFIKNIKHLKKVMNCEHCNQKLCVF